jgi:hypothetical protein
MHQGYLAIPFPVRVGVIDIREGRGKFRIRIDNQMTADTFADWIQIFDGLADIGEMLNVGIINTTRFVVLS